jgi:hypothetical protein
VRALEGQGRANDALLFLSEIAHIEMRKESYERLMQAAAQVGNVRVLALAEKTHTALAAIDCNRRLRLRSLLRLAGKQRDSVLESLYLQALREIRHEHSAH